MKAPRTVNEVAMRWRKVALLLAAAAEGEVPPAALRKLDAAGWQALAAVAGVPEPSEITIELAIACLDRARRGIEGS